MRPDFHFEGRVSAIKTGNPSRRMVLRDGLNRWIVALCRR